MNLNLNYVSGEIEQNTNSSILLLLIAFMNLTQFIIIVFIKIEFRQFINV